MKDRILGLAKKYSKDLIEIRRDFHRYPEIGYEEERTSRRISEILDGLGIRHEKGVGTTGIVGLIHGEKEGEINHKVVMLRSDMDALKLRELNEHSYRSVHEGVMHACGHDGHITWLIGAARILQEMRSEFSGTVKLVFQPAEEGLGGAKRMVEDGVMENPKPDMVFGAHIWPDIESGKVGLKYGGVMAAPTMFTVNIIGKGGHAAMPHLTVDPISISNLVYQAFMQIVARRANPLEPMVLSVTQIHGGTAHNIIPEEVVMKGTVRTITNKAGLWVKQEMEKVLKQVCGLYGASYTFDFNTYYPPVINDDDAVDQLANSITELLGQDVLVQMEQPSMAGEDFSFYLQETKGAFFMIGTRNPEKKAVYPLHSPYFQLDEDVLHQASAIMVKVALDYLEG